MPDQRVTAAETDPLRSLTREVADLRRELNELRAARRARATAIDASDGSLRVIDGGVELLRIGDVGGDARGTVVRRNTGQISISATSQLPNSPGFVALYDASSNPIVADDAPSGYGLSRPYLPIMVGDITTEPAFGISSSTFVSVALGHNPLQSPKLAATIYVYSSSTGTTGQARLAIDGVPIGDTVTIVQNAQDIWAIQPVLHGVTDYTSVHTVEILVRRTAGTGFVSARPLSMYGVESAYDHPTQQVFPSTD